MSVSEFMPAVTPPGLAAAATSEPPSGKRLDRKRFNWSSIPLLLPALALLAALFVGPVIYSFYLGFTNDELIGPTSRHFNLTGATNLHRLIDDPVFHQSLYLTAFFVLGSAVVGATLVGLILAVAMQNALGITRVVVGGVVVVCFVLPPVVVALAWYAAATGHGTYTAMFLHPNSDFLSAQPLLVVSAANAWNLTGLAMILFAAALRNISGEILESAQMENANAVQRFFRITLPLLRPTVVTTILLMTLLALANFTVVYVMTAGGPGTSTMILPVYSYLQAFQYDNLGYGALIGDAMVILATVLAFIYVRLSRERT
jgi:multiple sugar transport system permease protein